MNNLNKKQKRILIFISCIILLASTYYYVYSRSNNFLEQEETLEIQETSKEQEKEKNTIKVHISGAVNNEGILELNEKARLADAIEKAGGLKENAYTDEINLAYVLEDGEKINLQTKEQHQKNENEQQATAQNNKEEYILQSSEKLQSIGQNVNNKSSKININTATQADLVNLPGIGESTAQKIINYRKENGKFKKIEEVKNVKGIGENKFNKIKNLISI